MKSYLLRPIGLVLFAALLGSCKMGAPESMLTEQSFKEAVTALQTLIGQRSRAFRIDVDDGDFIIQMQDPAAPTHIDAWTHYHYTYRNIISGDGTSGPSPVEPTLVNLKLDENLFNLADIDFAAWPKLAQAAVERAGLQDPARVTKVDIQRRIFLIPSPSNGEVRWTLDMRSGRESASIYANAKGAITGGNFDGTQRAQKLDMYKGGKLLTDAIQTPNPGIPVALFSVDEVDWSVLPKVMAAVKQALQMPRGQVDGIHITQPGNPAKAIEWEVWVTDRSDRGWVTASNAGEVLRVHPPEGRRP